MSNRLTTQDLTACGISVSRLVEIHEIWRLAQINAELHEKIKVFEATVWFPRLQAQVSSSDSRGMAGTCHGIKVLTWCCAGRCLIQLERGDCRVTLITADDEKPWTREMCHQWPSMGPMGFQSVDGNYEDVMVMMYEATRYGQEIVLAPSPDVTIT